MILRMTRPAAPAGVEGGVAGTAAMSRVFAGPPGQAGPQARTRRLPPMGPEVGLDDGRTGTARSKSAESTRRRREQLGSTANGHGSGGAELDGLRGQLAKLGQQFQVLTTEVYRLAKERNREKVETLAQQLHAKARVVDTLVDDHRRINQDLHDLQAAQTVSQQEHQNVARNLDAIVHHVNTKMASLGDAIASGAVGGAGDGGGAAGGPDGGAGGSNVASAAAAADAAAARDLLRQLVQTQQEQAQGTAAVAQREARKSAILFSAVVQMGQLLDGLRSDVAAQLGSLGGRLERSLGLADDPDPDAFRALSTREAAAMEQRLQGNIRTAAAETAEALVRDRQDALGEVGRRREDDRRVLNNLGVEAQKLKIQLQLEAQQRRELEQGHQRWLAQLREGLIASGEEAGGRIAAVLAQVEQANAATRAEAQRAVDEQREQLLAELERRAVELRTVETSLAAAVRDAEDRLVDKIAARQSAAETNAHRLVQRCDTLEGEVRTVTDAITRSLSGLKDTHGGRLAELEKVIKAEISARQAEHGSTKARLEGVVASITRAIDAVQENTADDLRELDERLLQTAAALNMSAQQGRQEMQRDVDRDFASAFDRLGGVEDAVGTLVDDARTAAGARAEAEVADCMERLVAGVELAAAEESTRELRGRVDDLGAELEGERRRRRELEQRVDELLERERTQRSREDLDWKETVGAATAWLQQAAAAGSDGLGGDRGSGTKKDPKVRVRGDIFAD